MYLTFFFVPSDKTVIYNGSYGPLRGVDDVAGVRVDRPPQLRRARRAGHAPDPPLGRTAVHRRRSSAHLCRIFFTGAFRRPRELNWIIGVTLLVLAIFNGFAGYSLPDDLLSGTGLRIAYSIALAVPLVGTWLAFLVFGGEFPASDILTACSSSTSCIIPALIGALLGAHLAIVWRQKHTQFPGPGGAEDNVVGSRLWPTYTAKTHRPVRARRRRARALGGLAQINPVWLYGPFDPSGGEHGRAARLVHGLDRGSAAARAACAYLHIGPYNISELSGPRVVLPGITFGLLYLVAVPRTPLHARPRRAQPARPAQRPPDAHRHRRRRC